jgi:4-hydroxybenzoate polyprenyltransferase/phosphoserine phosphatase
MTDMRGDVKPGVPPLVVDLDGTLIRSDLSLESGFAFMGMRPWLAFRALGWLAEGLPRLKHEISHAVPIDAASLPYDERVLALLKEEKQRGREIVLATASHRHYADQIAAHLPVIDRVMATEGEVNLAAANKRDALLSAYGDKGYDYVGNSRDDLVVWASARRAYVVNARPSVCARAEAQGNVAQVLPPSGNHLADWAKALRLHQWAKNLLILVPLLASHRIGDNGLLLRAVLAFLCFGLCASSVYLLNDLVDIGADRHHPSKSRRPFAAGRLSLMHGFLAVPLLLALAFGLAAVLLPWRFMAALAVYYVLTLAYSLGLKRLMSVDVIVLAGLYTLRIIAGTFAFGVSLTFWMLAFSMFMFLSLALVKRYDELQVARRRGSVDKTRGRGYYPSDLEMVASLGAASGYISVMVLALYIQDPATVALYRHPHIIWLACPLLLFWVSRVWMLTHRGQMHDDPVVFALKDRISLGIGVLFSAIFWLAV